MRGGGVRENREQHRKTEATLARHEQSMEEIKAAVYTTEAATKSISRQVQKIRMALNVDCDANEEDRPPPPRLDAASLVRRAKPCCLFPPSIFAEEACSHAQQPHKTQTLADVEERRRPADTCNTRAEGRRLEGGEEEVQSPGAERNGTVRQQLLELQLPGLDRSSPSVPNPQLPELLNGFQRMGGRGLGTGREPARRQTSHGQIGGGANEHGGNHDNTVTNNMARSGSGVCNRTLTPRTEPLRTESQISVRRQVACVCGAV